MTLKEAIQILKTHNEWRRGADVSMGSTTELGIAIDIIVSEIPDLQLKIQEKICNLLDQDRLIIQIQEENKEIEELKYNAVKIFDKKLNDIKEDSCKRVDKMQDMYESKLKDKDEMLENFLTRFKDAIIYGFTISEYNELLNQYNQSK